jgi:hypothetical protein
MEGTRKMNEPKTEALIITRRTLDTIVDELVIANHDNLEFARDVVRKIRSSKDQVDDEFSEHIAQAHRLHKGMVAQRKKFIEPLDKLKTTVERKMGAYLQAEEDKAAAERKRLADIAHKEAEEARLAEAERLEAEGENEAAAAVIEAPIAVVAPAPPPPPKVEGVVQRKTWKHRIVDEALVPRQFCSSDDRKLREYARSMQSQAGCAGVEFYCETSVSTRKAAV